MDIFDILTMVGGLCLFLFGMNIMGESLERLPVIPCAPSWASSPPTE